MRRPLVLALLAVALGAALVAFVRKRGAEREVAVRSFTTSSPSQIPIIAVRAAARGADAPAAFLVHGFQCNKSMMMQLAKFLALNGVDAYAIDLPGHGASRERYDDERAALVAMEALEYLGRHEGVAKERLVLIGHSYGATVVGRVLRADAAYPAAILLGPGATPGLSPTVPRDLLVLTGGRDYDFVARYARDIIDDTTGDPSDAALARGERRSWRVIPGVGHVGLLVSAAAYREVLGWIIPENRAATRVERAPATAETLLLAVLVPAAVALAVLLWSGPAPVSSLRPSSRGFIVLGCAWAAALLAIRYVAPLALVRLGEGEILASLILLAGLVATVLDIASSRGAHLPRLREVARGLPVALAGVATLYLCAAAFLEHDLYRLLLTPARGGIAVLLAFTLFPFFAVCEGVLPHGGWQRLVALCFLYGVVALTLSTLQIRLERFAPALFGWGVLSGALGAVVRRVSTTGSAAAFSALTAGWILAAGFIRY